MSKNATRREGDDTTTSRGTVKGHHSRPGDDVTEGGPAEAPKEDKASMKSSASHAVDGGAVAGENTSSATVGSREKEQAARAGAEKTQSGRGHRKHEE